MGKKLNLETQIMGLEEAMMNKETVAAMKTGASAMKQATAETNIEEIDDMNDDLAEAMDAQAEINEALNNPIMDDFDEDDLMEELNMLEELEAEEMMGDLPTISVPSNHNKVPANTITDLPDAPQTKLAKEDEDEDELNNLLMMN